MVSGHALIQGTCWTFLYYAARRFGSRGDQNRKTRSEDVVHPIFLSHSFASSYPLPPSPPPPPPPLPLPSGVGDDARKWGPPFMGDESVYFFSVNRNKKVGSDFMNGFDHEAVSDASVIEYHS